jgi:hypothetical protein
LLLLGHVGITFGLVYYLIGPLRPGRAAIDYRVVALGAILSDLVDKPSGWALGILGRNVGHTFLFAAVLTAALLLPLVVPDRMPRALVKRLSNPFPYLAVGVWTHLALDRMWELPSVLLWPGMGLAFPPSDGFGLLDYLAALSDPYVLGGELAGLILILSMALRHRLYLPGRLRAFLASGRLPGWSP